MAQKKNTTTASDFREEMTNLAKGLKNEELLDFIVELCEGSAASPVFEAFQLRFGGRVEGIPRVNYENIVDQAIGEAEAHGKYDFFEEWYLEDVLKRLLEQGRRLLEEGEYGEVFEICVALLDRIPEHIERIPEDIGEVEQGIIDVIGLLGEILGQTLVPADVEERVFEYLLEGLDRRDLRDWGFGNVIWAILEKADLRP